MMVVACGSENYFRGRVAVTIFRCTGNDVRAVQGIVEAAAADVAVTASTGTKFHWESGSATFDSCACRTAPDPLCGGGTAAVNSKGHGCDDEECGGGNYTSKCACTQQ